MVTEDLINDAKEFFETYKQEIGKFAKQGKKTVHLSFQDLVSHSHQLTETLIHQPEETLRILELALEEKGLINNARVRLLDLPDSQAIKIRNIRAKHLNSLIAIEGIIRQASDVRPQVVNAKFECPNCGSVISVLQIDKNFREPNRCSCGRKGGFRLVSKDMVDAQRVVVEESPESLTGSEQPRRLSIFLKEDLVEPIMAERTTPGSRVKVLGTLKEVPIPLKTGAISTRFDLAVEANNIIPLEETFEELKITDEDERQIRELAADPQLYIKLKESIAPSVFGHEEVKEALVLQLFGGIRKERSDGTFGRGDLHMLLVGDPGVAKSVILKFISSIAPKGRYVSGKATTAAGITATIVRDEFLKGWSLEAGTMVLANKGLCAIDELEDMAEEDRSSLHEAMEQQCYLPDLEITFADNSKKKIGLFIDSLIEKNKEKIQNGTNCEILPLKEEIKILTTDFESIYPTKIDKVSRHIAPNKFIKITLNNGREITVTPEHPCWIIDSGKITTTAAQSLKEGNFFPIPGELPINGEEQTFSTSAFKNGPELCKLLGYHITDGCYELNRGKKNGIQFCNNDKKLINDYFNSIKSVFNINPLITKRNDLFAVRVISKKVVDFFNSLDKNLMEKGKLKKIPEKIMKCKKEDIAFLLRALFDGDGTVVNIKRGGCRITLNAENIEFAKQANELLLRFGIVSSIYWDREFFKVDICGQENLLLFYQTIGFLSEKKQARLKKYLEKQKTYRSISDIIPNVSSTIREIFNHLKISQQKHFGNQIYVHCHKHRPSLQKMLNIAEEKILSLTKAKNIVENTADSAKLGKIRKKLELSTLDISKKLGLSQYMLKQNEKRKIKNKRYQKTLLLEIDNMLSVLPKVKEIKKLAFGKIRWSKIKSVETIKNQNTKWVYDITVKPTHSFISNNMVLHNSISISKANVQAVLKAETSVLAAANPKFGRFDLYQPIAQQINIDVALLNRFDLIFVLRDIPEKSKDEAIATHVLLERKGRTFTKKTIEPELFRKYLAYSKQKISPELTDKAIDEIKRFYVDLRNRPMISEDLVKPIPITARQLEALVRMAEANAKARLSKKVTKEDAKKAIELLKYCLMQVGFDYESKQIDIDKISTGITASQKNKIILVREAITRLESRLGKLIPLEELSKELGEKIDQEIIEEIIDKLAIAGDIFKPKRGFIQRM